MTSETRETAKLYTVEEVAAYLRVSRAYVYRLPIRFSKVGSKRRYLWDDIQAYLTLTSSRATPLKRIA